MESTTGAEEYTDAASRSVDRYEVKFPLKEPYTDRRFVSNRILLSLLKPVIGGRCVHTLTIVEVVVTKCLSGLRLTLSAMSLHVRGLQTR